jgi:hypothetical protein
MVISIRGKNMKGRIKSFKLGSHNIKVQYKSNVIGPDGYPVLGLSEFLNNRIYVATSFQGKAIAEEVVEHTLYHEVSHFMMYLMNKQELNQDEAFVDVLGGLIAQLVKSMR